MPNEARGRSLFGFGPRIAPLLAWVPEVTLRRDENNQHRKRHFTRDDGIQKFHHG